VISKRKVRLGLIGLGYIGRRHLRNCLHLKSAELVAVSDISKKAISFAKAMGVRRAFQDYNELLKERTIDAVIIALPNFLHESCAKAVAAAGKDIFMEKPLARNVAEGKEILSATKKNGTKLMVGYVLRFYGPFRSLKEKIESGVLGEVEMVYASKIDSGPFIHRSDGHAPVPVPSWWFKKELTGGGALLDQGCYLINLLRWYFGEVVDIKSYLGHRFNMDFEDHAICMAKFKCGTIALLKVGWFSKESQTKVELLGTVKHAVADLSPSNKIISAIQLLTGITPRFDIPYLSELQHFVHCVREDLPPSPSGNEALRDLEIISMAYNNQISLNESTIS